jgi:hypothetical protein
MRFEKLRLTLAPSKVGENGHGWRTRAAREFARPCESSRICCTACGFARSTRARWNRGLERSRGRWLRHVLRNLRRIDEALPRPRYVDRVAIQRKTIAATISAAPMTRTIRRRRSGGLLMAISPLSRRRPRARLPLRRSSHKTPRRRAGRTGVESRQRRKSARTHRARTRAKIANAQQSSGTTRARTQPGQG